MISRFLAAALGGATALALAAPPAAADDPPPLPSIAYMGGAIVSDGATATVRIAYTCTSVQGTLGNHLWVAVKQGPDVSPQNASSGDQTLTAFLDTNWSRDAGSNQLTCDGRQQHQKVVLQFFPFHAPYGDLQKGPALLQLCITDNITGFNGPEPIGGFNLAYTMEKVIVTGGKS